jgi:hypothetical protein
MRSRLLILGSCLALTALGCTNKAKTDQSADTNAANGGTTSNGTSTADNSTPSNNNSAPALELQ